MGFGNVSFRSGEEFMNTRVHPLEDGFYTVETLINEQVVSRQYYTKDEFEIFRFEVNNVDKSPIKEVKLSA